MDKYGEMAKWVGTSCSIDNLLNNTSPPYSMAIMAEPFPPKFKVPLIGLYDGFKDLTERLETLKAHMTLHGFPKEVAYQPSHSPSRVWQEDGLGIYIQDLLPTPRS